MFDLLELAPTIENYLSIKHKKLNWGKKLIVRFNLHEHVPKIEERAKKWDVSMLASFFSFVYSINTRPKCGSCNSNVLFHTFRTGFKSYCSFECISDDADAIHAKRKNTTKEKYGVDHVMQLDEIKKKLFDNIKEKHGGVGMASPSINIKYKKSMEDIYGTQSANSHINKERRKKTELIRFGGPSGANMDIRKKVKKTVFKRYGGYYVTTEKFKETSHETKIEKYGNDYAKISAAKSKITQEKMYGGMGSASLQIREKAKATQMQKYGGVGLASEHAQAAYKRNFIKKHGVDSGFKVPAIRAKMEATHITKYGGLGYSGSLITSIQKTMLEKYGVKYAMQNQELFEKQQTASHLTKNITVGGKNFICRGYEDIVINWFFNQGKVHPKNIITCKKDELPSFKYDNNRRRYYPDMLVKYKNKWCIYEIKSIYTLFLNSYTRFKQIKQKGQAVIDAGYNFQLIVVHNNRLYFIENFLSMTRQEVAEEVKSYL